MKLIARTSCRTPNVEAVLLIARTEHCANLDQRRAVRQREATEEEAAGKQSSNTVASQIADLAGVTTVEQIPFSTEENAPLGETNLTRTLKQSCSSPEQGGTKLHPSFDAPTQLHTALKASNSQKRTPRANLCPETAQRA